MNRVISSIKFSAFGDFELIDYSPDNVSKLFNAFLNDSFVPNIINVVRIVQPQNSVSQIQRPQLVNNEIHCSISILPERIDIETNRELNIDSIVRYLMTIADKFSVGFNRLALNKATVIKYLGYENMRHLSEMFTFPGNYSEEESLIEYSSHRVSRKYIADIGEMINVGRNIEGIPSVKDGVTRFDEVMIETDINTLGENRSIRFDASKCLTFFKEAVDTDKIILDAFEGAFKDE